MLLLHVARRIQHNKQNTYTQQHNNNRKMKRTLLSAHFTSVKFRRFSGIVFALDSFAPNTTFFTTTQQTIQRDFNSNTKVRNHDIGSKAPNKLRQSGSSQLAQASQRLRFRHR